jgi:multiple sugar transport system substrate-binding protein
MMRQRDGRLLPGASAPLAAAAPLSRRELVRRTGLVGAGLAASPLLASMRVKRAAAQDDIPRTPSAATVDGTLRIVLVSDFHPDHNAFMRAELEAYAAASGWSSFEISDAAGYQGGGDLFQKLLGGVQANDAPDMVIHNLSVRNYVTLGLVTPVTDLVNEMVELYGETVPGAAIDSVIDGEWYGVPFHTRAGGLYVRKDVFDENGLDPDADTDTYDKLRDAALAVSKPDQNMWGWGMTVNRSGDGNSMVREVIYRHGGHLQDETGQKVTFNSPETIAGLEWLKETYTAEMYAPMLPPGVLSWIDTDNNAAFLAGQIAVTDNAGTMYAKAQFDQVPFADQIVYIPRPVRISDGARIDFMSGGTKFHQVTGSPNTDATADIIRHFLTPPVQERVWSISTGYALPAYASGWDSPIITEDENSMRGKAIALNETDFTGLQWPGPLSEAVGSINEGVFFTDMMSEIIQGRAVDEVVADYHDQFVQIFQDFGLEGE